VLRDSPLIGEGKIKEIDISGSIDDVYNRIKTSIDPFYIRADDEAYFRKSDDIPEDEDWIPLGEYGPYCPITLKKQNWLIPGSKAIEVL